MTFIQLEGELFEAVQKSSIFPDSKTFVDAIPNKNPAEIIKAYHQNPPDLKAFVREHFTIPEELTASKIDASSASDYITKMWSVLLRPMQAASPHDSLISLPHPHIVPGGRFREMYYWDSYFVSLGLDPKLVRTQAQNCAHLIDQFGFVPNGNRHYYLTRSQPPMFSFLVATLENPEEFFPQLEKEYSFWMEKRSAPLLNRYYDTVNTPRPESYAEDLKLYAQATPQGQKEIYRNLRATCESGWDFSSRWFKEEGNFRSINTTQIIPVDLNCFLYHLELLLSKTEAAEKRKQTMLKHLWNGKEGFFFDYSLDKEMQTSVWSLAGAVPLFVNLCSQEMADRIANHLQSKFLSKGGLLTTLHETKQQWDMPNGWAPLQWMAIKGLMNYGHLALAKEISAKWIKTIDTVFNRHGHLYEKYDVSHQTIEGDIGEYQMQKGFGWTNGVYTEVKKWI